MKLSDYLEESGILLDITGDSKSEILSKLVEILANMVSINDSAEIMKTLQDREKLKTTGIGSGIAIPHCKSSEVDRVHVVLGISRQGIDFDSLDQQPANFFFLLVAPENAGSEHLKASAKIVRLVRDDTVREHLLKMNSAKDVLEYIKSKEDASA
ncbi:MAG: PTS sugar transporter subunit IIA [Deltaproteobacteria bacterium]|jgi:fructose PTS system EIIBC or EIIC component|nr:PTS sugar transporter subunit IIA [Deltaproteobacteria bacterium]MBT4267746.1 PTS sugar transporter subunit IIA [Deltaproteobacteria bacterium]MBT4637508.1 PTS sugar transporter subunit IIA [Deltaproteobacteria bacterium]MBT6504530.1 PTS sugar transporter subunit IIA [Deltaproteobacteria bacterium]MBT6614305.1 PTS sugar transporter subunit IIA [Deltaproteobacteria bacterium]